MKPQPGMICLAGATATGKSAVALALAERLGGEIISVDSMQVYRGLDIGTAKPSREERERILHHLIDVVELSESFDAARFARLAHEAVEDIGQRGKVAILCGGTGLYFKAFLEGVGEAPPANAPLREELERVPLSDLLDELQAKDPKTFAVIDRKNARRVVRAVEVIRLTGRPFSEQRAGWQSSSLNPEQEAEKTNIQHRGAPAQPNEETVRIARPRLDGFFGLMRNADDLQARINSRVDLMFARGLVEEVRKLLQHGLAENRTAMQAIGYRQVVEHLRGERNLPETIELVKVRTRQFAKRQMTWFKRHAQVSWLNVQPGESASETAERISQALASSPA